MNSIVAITLMIQLVINMIAAFVILKFANYN